MNPDVFITIVFVGLAVLVAFVALVFVVLQMRRSDARVERREAQGPPHTKAVASTAGRQSETRKAGRDAAVH